MSAHAESTKSAPSIRPATSRDADDIAQVYIDSAQHHAEIDPDRYYIPTPPVVVERYRRGGQHPPGTDVTTAVTLVAELDGRIVGFADVRLVRPLDAMHRPDVACYVSELAVAAAHRSHGIGERLLSAAEDWGRARGAVWSFLEYNALNPRAARFYHERMGYRTMAVTAGKKL
jgi:GNAT superfamily N-acetyltransferase